MRVKAVVEYLGTAYAGWQSQPEQATVQAALQDALSVALGVTVVKVEGAGRTDSGVHALGQVAAFNVPDDTDLHRLRASLNGITARDIAVATLEKADAGFDPRRDARSRCYRYTLVCGRPPSPLLADRSWHIAAELDRALLDRMAAAVAGRHDFSAFRAADCESPTTVREVASSIWRAQGHALEYEVRANAFLKQMVRVLVGSQVEVALGKLEEEAFYRLLGGGSREDAGPTAPARGLTLVSVDY